ncbi:MAG: hypothetical protein AB2693_21335 [Candidatus Thiodiazotropha sp.]
MLSEIDTPETGDRNEVRKQVFTPFHFFKMAHWPGCMAALPKYIFKHILHAPMLQHVSVELGLEWKNAENIYNKVNSVPYTVDVNRHMFHTPWSGQ